MNGRGNGGIATAATQQDLLRTADMVRVGLAGSIRNFELLTHTGQRKKLSEIADELMLSPKTVSVYRARVLEKLHLSNNAELTVYAIRNGLV
mgnify:CR=1 FL=1